MPHVAECDHTGVDNLHLLNDTGTVGDKISSNPGIGGQVSGGSGSLSGPVQFDLNGDGSAEGSVNAAPDGTFGIDLSGSVVSPGTVTVHVRGGVAEDLTGTVQFGGWTAFDFTYEPDDPSSSDPALYLPNSGNTDTFLSGRLEPSIDGLTGASPSMFSGVLPSVIGAFPAFANRFNPTGGSTFTTSLTDADTSPTTSSYSDSSGTYSVTLVDTSSHDTTSMVDIGGTWDFVENLTNNVTLQTLFTGVDGSHWNRTQVDSHSYDFHGWSTTSGSKYNLIEDLSSSFNYHWWTSTAGESHNYDSFGSQSGLFTALGTELSDSTGTSTDESGGYLASETDSYSNKGNGTGVDLVWSVDGIKETSWSQGINVTTSVATDGSMASSRDYSYIHSSKGSDEISQEHNQDETHASARLTTHTVRHTIEGWNSTNSSSSDVHGAYVRHSSGTTDGWNQVNRESDTGDTYDYALTQSIDSADASQAGVSVTSKTNTESSANRVRLYHDQDKGHTSVQNGALLLFTNETNGSNQSDSKWTLSNVSHTEGTDSSISGTSRSFASDRSNSDAGGAHYVFASVGTRTVHPSGFVDISGKSTTTQTSQGTTTWDNADSSASDSTNSATPSSGITNTTITSITAESTDSGASLYSAHSLGHAIADSFGTHTDGTSSYDAQSKGNETGKRQAHNVYNSTDTSRENVARTFKNDGTSSAVTNGQYDVSSNGSATYNDGNSSSTDSTTRHDSGTTGSENQETDSSKVADTNLSGKNSNSGTTTKYLGQRSGIFDATSVSTVTTINGARSWLETSDRNDKGTDQSESDTVTSSDVQDESSTLNTSRTITTTHLVKSATGKYASASHSDTGRTADGSSDTSSNRDDEKSGTYTVTSDSHVDYASTDNSTPLAKSSKFHTDETYDGTGTYSETSRSDEIGASDGTHKSESFSDATNADSGATTFHSVSTSTLNGTEVLSEGVTRTASSIDNYTEDREGNSKATASHHASANNDDGTVTSASSDDSTYDEGGNSKWNQSVSSLTKNSDTSSKTVSKSAQNTTTSKNIGDGAYTKKYTSHTEHNGDGTWSSHNEGSDHSEGTSGFTRDVVTESHSKDTTDTGITKNADSDTSTKEDGGSNWSSNDAYSTERLTDGTSNSLVTSSSDTHSKGDTKQSHFHEKSAIDQDTSSKGSFSYAGASGNSTSTTTQQSTKSHTGSETTRDGGGAFTEDWHSESTVVDGTNTASINSSDRVDDGTFTSHSDSVGNVDVAEKAGSVLDRASHRDKSSSQDNKGTFHGESGNGATLTKSNTYNRYEEAGTFSSSSASSHNGYSNEVISAKTDAHRDTLTDTAKDSSSVKNGAFSNKTQDSTETLVLGSGSSYHQTEQYSAGDTKSHSERHTVVHEYSNEPDPDGGIKFSRDATDDRSSASDNTNGKYASWAWNESNSGSAGINVSGATKDTQSSDYNWHSGGTLNVTEKAPGDDLGGSGLTGPVTDVWTTHTVLTSDGTGSSSNLSNSDWKNAKVNTSSGTDDNNTGTYSQSTNSTHTHDEMDAPASWKGGKTTGHSFSSSVYGIDNGKSKHTSTTSAHNFDDGTYSNYSKVTDDDQGDATWSNSSVVNGTEAGTRAKGCEPWIEFDDASVKVSAFHAVFAKWLFKLIL